MRRVVLCDRRDDRGRYYEEASIAVDGGVTILDEDSGSSVGEFFGPGLDDYEWSYTVPPERVPDLVEALGGTASDDVLALIKAHYENQGGTELGKLLRSAPVSAKFFSYSS